MSNPVPKGASTPWAYVQTHDENCDFNKELYSMPDKGNTSVDLRLTFNTDTHTAYYMLLLNNDSGNSVEFEMPTGRNYLPWAVALEMLGDEVEIPQELVSQAPVPATRISEASQAFKYPALAKLSRDVDACSAVVVKFHNLRLPELLTENEIKAIVDALDFQRTGKPDFMTARGVAPTVAKQLKGAYDVRIEIGGPEKYRYLDQDEVDVIVQSLDAMSVARESTFLNDGIREIEGGLIASAYSDSYPWQNRYNMVHAGGSISMDSVAMDRLARLYTFKGAVLRDAIRHAEIVGDPVPQDAYARLETLKDEVTSERNWKDASFRDKMRTGTYVTAETHLLGLSVPLIGKEQIERLSNDTLVTEAHVREKLKNLCLAFQEQAVLPVSGLQSLLLSDDFVYETLRRTAGAWEYMTWAKDDPNIEFRYALPDAIRMWAVAHIVAERPECVVCLKESLRCGVDPFFNGYFGAGAARWEPATFIAGNQFVAASTDESGLTHMVLFVGDSAPNEWKAANARVIDALHKQPSFDGQFGSLLIERGFPKQVSPVLAQSALEVVKENCTDIDDSRAILKADVLGFRTGTDVKKVIAWLSEHGATAELVADKKQFAPDNGPSPY